MLTKWVVLEDWTHGKYPGHNGGVRPFARCLTRWGAHRLARRMNRMFWRYTTNQRPNVEYRVQDP